MSSSSTARRWRSDARLIVDLRSLVDLDVKGHPGGLVTRKRAVELGQAVGDHAEVELLGLVRLELRRTDAPVQREVVDFIALVDNLEHEGGVRRHPDELVVEPGTHLYFATQSEMFAFAMRLVVDRIEA